jgi:DNA-binding response OmpR family regulator
MKIVPVIAITGRGEHPVALAMEADADAVLNKPFEFVDLDRHVTKLLAKKG